MADVTSSTASKADRESAIQLERVLDEAESIGVEQALAQYGSGLTDAQRSMVAKLSPDEVHALRQASGQLGAFDRVLPNQNNNGTLKTNP